MVEPLSQVIVSEEFTRLLITFVVPFVIFFAILLWVIKRTKIFGDSNFIYVLLAGGLTVMIYAYNPGNVFQFLSYYLFQIGVTGSIIALLAGTILVFFPIMRGISRMVESPAQKVSRVEKERAKLLKKFYRTWSTQKRIALAEEVKHKERELDYLRARFKIR